MVYYKNDKNLLICKKMSQHLNNCKYCNESVQKNIASFLTCHKCDSNIHITCLKRRSVPSGIIGDEFFTFTCAECSDNHAEVFIRPKLSCLQVLLLTIYHLHFASPDYANKGFYHWKLHIETFIERKWNSFFPKSFLRKSDWVGIALETLGEKNPFLMSGQDVVGEPGWWKLTHKEVSPAFTIRICNKRKLHNNHEELQCARKFIMKYGTTIEFEEVQLPDEPEMKIELQEEEEDDHLSMANVDISIVKEELDDLPEFATQLCEEPSYATSEIWADIETIVSIKIPKHLQRILEICGFDSIQLIKIAPSSWLHDIENFIKTSDPSGFLCKNEIISDILGPIYKTVTHYRIPPGHKLLLNTIKQKLLMQNAIEHHFDVSPQSQPDMINFDDEKCNLTIINNTLNTWMNTNQYKIDNFKINLTQSGCTIQCPFQACCKPMNVYKDTKRNRWVLSNFTTHYKNHFRHDPKSLWHENGHRSLIDQPSCSKTPKRSANELEEILNVGEIDNKKFKPNDEN